MFYDSVYQAFVRLGAPAAHPIYSRPLSELQHTQIPTRTVILTPLYLTLQSLSTRKSRYSGLFYYYFYFHKISLIPLTVVISIQLYHNQAILRYATLRISKKILWKYGYMVHTTWVYSTPILV